MKKIIEKVSFWTTGDNMTYIIRDLWESNLIENVFEICNPNLKPEDIVRLCTGKLKLEGDTREDPDLQVIDDNTEVYFTLEKQIQKLESDFIYFSDYNARLKREFEFSQLPYKTPKYKEVEIKWNEDLYEGNKKRIKIALKGLELLYPLINKSIADLPMDKIGTTLSGMESQTLENIKEDFEDIQLHKEQEQAYKTLNFLKEVARKSIEKKSIKIKPSDIKNEDSWDGWLSPKGEFYACDYQGHVALAYDLQTNKIIPDRVNEYNWLETNGWIKMSSGKLIFWGKKLTQKQIDSIFDFWSNNPAFKQGINFSFNDRDFKNMEDFFQDLE